MQLSSATGVSRPSAVSIILAMSPLVVVLVWYLVGQWDSAGPESRAWLQMSGLAGLASLTPLPGRRLSLVDFFARIQWWGWAGIIGLLVTS